MKKIIISLLIFSVLLLTVSCSDYADHPNYESITYKENGFSIVMRNDMQRYEANDYDFYFSNVIGTVALTASRLGEDFLTENGLSADATAEEYVDYIIDKSEMDKENLFYEEDKEREAYSFRYTYAEDGKDEVFYYVVVIGGKGNIWYVEMTCLNSDSEMYLARFEEWKDSIEIYTPTE